MTTTPTTRLFAKKTGTDTFRVQASHRFDGYTGRVCIGVIARMGSGWSFDIFYAGTEFGRGGERSLETALAAIRKWVDAVDAEDAAHADDPSGYFNEEAAYEAAQDTWAFWQGEIERNAMGV
jgi:hypothetical protein